MTYPSDTSARPPPAPYPPAAPPLPVAVAAAAALVAPPAPAADTCNGLKTDASEQKTPPLSGFGTGSFGPSAISGFGGGASFGLSSIPAPASTPASSLSDSGFHFSSSSAGLSSSLFGSSSTASSSSSGFGSGSLVDTSIAQPAPSSTTSSSFGGSSHRCTQRLNPPPSSFTKSPFGLPNGHQPVVATPVPSTAVAFGCSVSYPHPSTFQVPPTSHPFVPVAPPPVPELKTPQPNPAAAAMKNMEKKKKAVSALVVDEEEGSARFPSRDDAEFRYRLTLTKRDRVKVWIEDKASKHQWESNELELSEIVPADRAIPMMKLSDYFECFKSCLLASSTGLFNGPSKHDLVLPSVDKEKSTGDKGDIELQLTAAVHIFSKVLSPTFSFMLHSVKLSEMDILNAKIRDQDEEIEDLRAQVDALTSKMESGTPSTGMFGAPASANLFSNHNAPPLYFRAETTDTTCYNYPMIWRRTGESSGLFGGVCQARSTSAINMSCEGLYNIQIVVHHTNTFDPEKPNTSNGPFGTLGILWSQREAFVLQKNGQPIASSFGSTPKGTVQSLPLIHILQLKIDDELRVVYTGAGVAKAGSYILITQIK